MSDSTKCIASELDAVLPQTQCGLCGFEGCRPYANAIAEGIAPINRCPPGGLRSLNALATLTGIDPTPYAADIEKKTQPRQLAVIREAECIGCKKCIIACPVNAILGSAKQMHSVLIDYCTGCNLCIPPCPVDCIDLIDHPAPDLFEIANQSRANFMRKKTKQQLAKKEAIISPKKTEKLNYLKAAIARGRAKRGQK